jgi:hypothetical protein
MSNATPEGRAIGRWLWPFVVWFSLECIERLAGFTVALWIASVTLAWCLGVFWGAGDQIRKHRGGGQ